MIQPEPLQKRSKEAEPEIVLSEEDQKVFIEHAAYYTEDKKKKNNKRWAEGMLWYDSGMCKIFDEDGKEIYK